MTGLQSGQLALVVVGATPKGSIPFFQDDSGQTWSIVAGDTELAKAVQGAVKTSLQASCKFNGSGVTAYAAPDPTCYEGIFKGRVPGRVRPLRRVRRAARPRLTLWPRRSVLAAWRIRHRTVRRPHDFVPGSGRRRPEPPAVARPPPHRAPNRYRFGARRAGGRGGGAASVPLHGRASPAGRRQRRRRGRGPGRSRLRGGGRAGAGGRHGRAGRRATALAGGHAGRPRRLQWSQHAPHRRADRPLTNRPRPRHPPARAGDGGQGARSRHELPAPPHPDDRHRPRRAGPAHPP